MNNEAKAAHYFELASDWQDLANSMSRKVMKNNGSSRELHAAIMRRDFCLQRRDACAEKARAALAA